MVEGLGFRSWRGFRVYGSRTAIGTLTVEGLGFGTFD